VRREAPLRSLPGLALSRAIPPHFCLPAGTSLEEIDNIIVELQKRKRRELSTVIVLADFGIGWIAQLSLLTSAKLDAGLCSASSMTRPPDVD